MNFAPSPQKPRAESIVPMINVVFLLLIFFLMTSTLVTPEPFEVSPPLGQAQDNAQSTPILYVSKDGVLGFEDHMDEAALAAFAAAVAGQTETTAFAPQLRADAQTSAARVAAVLKSLAAAGLSNVSLVVAAK
ncbi:ExbD/TolR family protein [Pacificibacter maritimus]|nr:biopolymer transporter ExbD [Pacificibacter maritimus]